MRVDPRQRVRSTHYESQDIFSVPLHTLGSTRMNASPALDRMWSEFEQRRRAPDESESER
jgi:hypothetical protein